MNRAGGLRRLGGSMGGLTDRSGAVLAWLARHGRMVVRLVAFFVCISSASAYPTGWVYMHWPYAYVRDVRAWTYLSQQDTQWICDMNTQGWTTFGNGGPRNGWVYFSWPYAYSQNQHTFYFFDSNSRLWLFNFATNAWELLARNGPINGSLSQARNLLGTWIGSGSYYTYAEYQSPLRVAIHARMSAQFRFQIEDVWHTGTNYGVALTVTPTSYQIIQPTGYLPDMHQWGTSAPTQISGSRLVFKCYTGDGSVETWAFNFTTDTMAGSISITRQFPLSWYGISSAGLNGITLTRER